MPDSTVSRPNAKPVTACLIGACDIELWGMTGAERAERLVRRTGAVEILIGGFAVEEDRTAFLLRTDTVINEALTRALFTQPGTMLFLERGGGKHAIAAHVTPDRIETARELLDRIVIDEEQAARAGIAIKSAQEIAGQYDAVLRKRSDPLVREITPDTVHEIEQATFDAAYKGVTDFVTKWIWPRVAFPVTRYLSRRQVTPNAVTAASFVCVIAALACFMNAAYLTGVVFGWLMALLDTVDGKLARVTLTSSRWGNVFDHGIDLVSPPFWWLAWWWGLEERDSEILTVAMWIVVGGYVAGKLLEQAFISIFGLKIHMWRRLDSLFRQVTARRNSNLAILTVFAAPGMPDSGFLAVAGWTILCFGFHSVRLIQAYLLRSKGIRIVSWLDT